MTPRGYQRTFRERMGDRVDEVGGRIRLSRDVRARADEKIEQLEGELKAISSEHIMLWREYNKAAEAHENKPTPLTKEKREKAKAALDEFVEEKKAVIAKNERELEKWRAQRKRHRFIAPKRKPTVDRRVGE